LKYLQSERETWEGLESHEAVLISLDAVSAKQSETSLFSASFVIARKAASLA
jgi:hypothetical protein